MPRPGRLLRTVVNPLSTGATRWCSSAVRRAAMDRGRSWKAVRARAERPWPAAEDLDDRSRPGELSPGTWSPPPGARPGWDWLPPGGLTPRLGLVPPWVRVWYHVPLVDRYAHVWMWHHGGWEIVATPSGDDPGDPAGDREPRRPPPVLPVIPLALDVQPP